MLKIGLGHGPPASTVQGLILRSKGSIIRISPPCFQSLVSRYKASQFCISRQFFSLSVVWWKQTAAEHKLEALFLAKVTSVCDWQPGRWPVSKRVIEHKYFPVKSTTTRSLEKPLTPTFHTPQDHALNLSLHTSRSLPSYS